MAHLTDAVGNSNKSCLFTPGSGNKRSLPAELQVEAGVCTADEEDQAEVSGADVQGADENTAADCAEDDRDDDVEVGFLESTRGVCKTAGYCVGNCVRWGLDEVCSECVEFECLHDLHDLLAIAPYVV